MFYEAVGEYEIRQKADLDDPGYQKDPRLAITFKNYAGIEVCFLQLSDTLAILRELKNAEQGVEDLVVAMLADRIRKDIDEMILDEETIDQAQTAD